MRRAAIAGLSVASLAALAAASTAAMQQHTITDQRGKTFTFSEPAHRVVTIAIPLTWTFMTVDGSDSRIVGANAVSISQMRDGIASKIFPHIATTSTAVTRGGTFTPNVEAMLALKPDAVFQWADRGDALYEVLDRAGLRALGVKNTSSESDIEAWIRMCGVAAGKEARADSIIRWMQSGNRRFDSLTTGIPLSERPRVLALTEYSKTISPNGPTSYLGTIVNRAGGRNAATVDGNVGIEQVLAWNPDVILLTHFEAKTPSDLIADPRWAQTNAAKHRRVYKLPFGVTRWGGYGPESPLLLSWLADVLQPNRLNLPLRDEMRVAYRQLFQYSVSDDDLDRILQLSENGASANYGSSRAPAVDDRRREHAIANDSECSPQPRPRLDRCRDDRVDRARRRVVVRRAISDFALDGAARSGRNAHGPRQPRQRVERHRVDCHRDSAPAARARRDMCRAWPGRERRGNSGRVPKSARRPAGTRHLTWAPRGAAWWRCCSPRMLLRPSVSRLDLH